LISTQDCHILDYGVAILRIYRHSAKLALYPGYLVPLFVTCNTNVEEVMVNWSRAMVYMYLDIRWTYGGMASNFCMVFGA